MHLPKTHLLRKLLYQNTRFMTVMSHELNDIKTSGIPFASAKLGNFYQEKPRLQNPYKNDAVLKSFLHKNIPKEMLIKIEPDLERFGNRLIGEIYDYGLDCQNNPPKLYHFDSWGNRIDEIVTSAGWKKMKEISAEEGIIAIAYERKYNEWSRLYQMAKLFLFAVPSNLFNCPLAMTDGAAKTIESLKLTQLEYAFRHLTSRDPTSFWTSGQWMTERRGGSDVANGIETVAISQVNGDYSLYGYKWFSSATDSDVSFTLARIPTADGKLIQGTRGLSLFFLKVRDENGKLNNLQVVKLKDKLGTRQLPTAELLLDGTIAQHVYEEGRGIAGISKMLTITRIHNSIASVQSMRWILNLSRDYSHRRKSFGQILKDHPLHMQILSRMDLEIRGCTVLILEICRLLGLEECCKLSDEDLLVFRLLTPIAKLYTAKQAIGIISEGLETFGGQGYMEDTGLPVILRDAQVTPIWEGTTNILSLDVLRAIMKSHGEVLIAYHNNVLQKLSSANQVPELDASCKVVKDSLTYIEEFLQKNPDKLEIAARDLSFSLSKVYIASLLIEHAVWKESTHQDLVTAQRWCMRNLIPVVTNFQKGLYSATAMKDDIETTLDSYEYKP